MIKAFLLYNICNNDDWEEQINLPQKPDGSDTRIIAHDLQLKIGY